MLNDAQILIGKVLQIRDKIMAKRHAIPNDLKAQWRELNKKTACFDSAAFYQNAVKGQSLSKHIEFTGSLKELSQLVVTLNAFYRAI